MFEADNIELTAEIIGSETSLKSESTKISEESISISSSESKKSNLSLFEVSISFDKKLFILCFWRLLFKLDFEIFDSFEI